MNALQLARKAQLAVDAIRTGNIASDLWSDEEVLDAINTAMEHAGQAIRLADADQLMKAITTTGTQTLDLGTELYTTSALRLVSGTSDYNLPPDFVRAISLLPLTDGFEAVVFKPAKNTQRFIMDLRSLTPSQLGSDNTEFTYWYSFIGKRGLRISPEPTDTLDIELIYQYRPAKLNNSTAAAVAIDELGSVVTGTGTTWLSDGLRTPCELVLGYDPPSSVVDINRQYPVIASIDSDTLLTLARPWQSAAVVDEEAVVSMVPQLSEEHHNWLGQLVAAILLRKINPELSDKSMAALKEQFVLSVRPEIELRQFQESLVTEAFEIR